MMYCNVCLEYESIADKNSSLFVGCSNIKDAPLKSHHNSTKHEKCVKAKIASLFPKTTTSTAFVNKAIERKERKVTSII